MPDLYLISGERYLGEIGKDERGRPAAWMTIRGGATVSFRLFTVSELEAMGRSPLPIPTPTQEDIE